MLTKTHDLSPAPTGLVEKALDFLFNREDIGNQANGRGLLYMRRWRVIGYNARLPKILGCNVMIHRMVRPDADKDPHDHPWDFVSFVLWGGYVEEIWPFTDKVPRHPDIAPTIFHRGLGAIAKRLGTHMHRVVSLPRGESWTLVFTNDRYRDWGFWTTDGWVYWRKYMGLQA